MDISLTLILLIVLAGFIKGFSGFGLSLILISVLFEMGFEAFEFLPIIVPLFVVLDVLLYFENMKHIHLDFEENFTLHPTTLINLFIGTLLGTFLLMKMDGSYFKIVFAFLVLIFLFLLVGKVDIHQMRKPSEKSNGFFGFGTGILTGLFTSNGIPTTIYLLYHQYPKEKYMANLVTFLLFSDLLLVSIYLFRELFTISGLIISAQFFIMVLAGFGIGIYLRRFVPTKTFKSLVILILAVNSLKIIFDHFMF